MLGLLLINSDGEGPSSSTGGSPPPAFTGAAPKFSMKVEAAPQVMLNQAHAGTRAVMSTARTVLHAMIVLTVGMI